MGVRIYSPPPNFLENRMAINTIISDPTKQEKITVDLGDRKRVDDFAKTCIFELDGKKRIKESAEGAELVESGYAIPKHKDSRSVACTNRTTGEVRWMDLSAYNPGRTNRMADILLSNWRFSTEEEEAKAIVKQQDALSAYKVKKDEANPAKMQGKNLDKMMTMIETVIAKQIQEVPLVEGKSKKTKGE